MSGKSPLSFKISQRVNCVYYVDYICRVAVMSAARLCNAGIAACVLRELLGPAARVLSIKGDSGGC